VLRPIRLYYLRQRSDRSITRYDFTHSVTPSSQVEVVHINVLLSSKRSLIWAAHQGVGPPPIAGLQLLHHYSTSLFKVDVYQFLLDVLMALLFIPPKFDRDS
jgi:hypothetical protein